MLRELLPIAIFITAILASYVAHPFLISLALRYKLLDHPGGRKRHTKAIPLIGGLEIATALAPAALYILVHGELHGFLIGASVMLLTGLADDYFGLGHWEKFLAQAAAVLAMAMLDNLLLHNFGNLLGGGDINIPWDILAALTTVFCVTGVINAVNMIDGLDGLAGGVSLIAFCSFAILAALNGDEILMFLAVGFAGAIFGFLRYNWHPAKIFMGDAGSLLIGFSLAYLAIGLTQNEDTAIAPIHVLLLLAVPITDTLVLMTKRFMQGKNPFRADCYHLHHLMLRHILNKKNTVKTILLMTLFFSVVSITAAFQSWPEHYLFFMYACYFIFMFTISFIQPAFLKLRLRFHRRRLLNSNSLLIKTLSGLTVKMLAATPLFRKAKRYPTSLSGMVHDSREQYGRSCKINDISLVGCKITCPRLYPKRDQLQLDLDIKLDQHAEPISLSLPGKSVWFRGAKDENCQHGILFDDLDDENSVHLSQLIEYISRSQQDPASAPFCGELNDGKA